MIMINNNDELRDSIKKVINENGIKKSWIAQKLGICNQNVNNLLNKKNISLDDANKILNLMGYKASVIIEKQQKNESMASYKANTEKVLTIHERCGNIILKISKQFTKQIREDECYV